MFMTLLIVLLFASAAAQDTCAACLAQGSTWCSTDFAGFCTPNPGNCGPNQQVTNAASCPPLPPDITANSIIGATGQTVALAPILGGVAGIALSLLTLTNLEGLSGKPPASSPVSTRTLHSILAAATLLWFATGFLLAAPTVPWVWLTLNPRFVVSGSMLTVFSCQAVLPTSGLPSPLCQAFPIGAAARLFIPGAPSIPLPNGGTTTLPTIAANAQNVAVCCYVFSLLILLPAAVLASASAYRLKQYLSHGTPTPIEGCAFTAFPAATFLSFLGLLSTIGILWAAIYIAGFTIGGTAASALLPNSPGAVRLAEMPGPVYGALALVCSFLAFSLLLLPTLCNPDMKTLPGYGWCGCRITCTAAHPAQPQGAAPSFTNPTQNIVQLATLAGPPASAVVVAA
jgi:hypothetical protein